MLVLTRKLQQQIKIGDQITVTILRVKGHTVRVGIEAPRDVRVVRGELPPKGEDGSETSEAMVIEAVVSITDELDSDAASKRAIRGQLTTCNAPAPKPSPSLPPRRVLSRMGSAPLRQIMASASLAK